MQLRLVGEESPPDDAPSFEAFWLLYPRKVARKDAMRAWNKITPRDQAAALDALVDWRRIFAAREEEKIPHAATWLNGERWEDELPREYRQHATAAATRSAPDPADPARIPMPQRVRELLASLKAKHQ